MRKKQITEFIITLLAKYPYIIAFLICLFINPFFYGSTEFIPHNTFNIIVISSFVTVTVFFYKKYKAKEIEIGKFLLHSCFYFFSFFVLAYLYNISTDKELCFFIGFSCLLITLFYYSDKTKYRFQLISLLIIGISFGLYISYVMGVSIAQMQHDVWSTTIVNGKSVLNGGHYCYIKYLQQEYQLPDCDVSKIWQFAHPPLHHILCAIWLEINEKVFNISNVIASESLQLLTLFYVMCIIISSYKIFRYFKLEGIPFYCALTVTCFFPTFIMFSGSINNDVLSVAFIMGTMLNALYWKKEPNVRNIINLALCFGLGIMSKVSTAMLAPALFIFFVSIFVKSQNKKDLVKQFAIFLLISVPIGTWFNIRNYINYKIPFNFVHHMDSIPSFKPQYVGNINFFDRITDFSFNQFDSVYVQNVELGSPRNDYNPIITLLKCALFDEFITNDTFEDYPTVNKVSVCFFIDFLVIVILSLFSMFYSTIQYFKQKNYIDEIIFMLVFFITIMLCIYKHSYDIPYVAAMNFRYITPTVIITQLFWGIFNQNSNLLQPKYRNIISSTLVTIFALCSTIVYSVYIIVSH